MSSLCPSCRASYERWIDYRFRGPLGRWRTDSPNGKHLELYRQRSVEALIAAKAERAALAQWQCALIKKICADQRHTSEVAA